MPPQKNRGIIVENGSISLAQSKKNEIKKYQGTQARHDPILAINNQLHREIGVEGIYLPGRDDAVVTELIFNIDDVVVHVVVNVHHIGYIQAPLVSLIFGPIGAIGAWLQSQPDCQPSKALRLQKGE